MVRITKTEHCEIHLCVRMCMYVLVLHAATHVDAHGTRSEEVQNDHTQPAGGRGNMDVRTCRARVRVRPATASRRRRYPCRLACTLGRADVRMHHAAGRQQCSTADFSLSQ
jgi:hypothetical protein